MLNLLLDICTELQQSQSEEGMQGINEACLCKDKRASALSDPRLVAQDVR